MKRFSGFLMALLFFGTLPLSVISQGKNLPEVYKMTRWSSPEMLPPPPEDARGFPTILDGAAILEGFQHPPQGYGQVPFWWWTGDPLNKDRLLWQIEELHDKGIPGMQVNYSHTREEGWPTDKAEPEIFSEAWWEIWKFVADKCNKRNMGIGLSGYTIDWPRGGENLFKEIIYSMDEINGKTIEMDTSLQIKAGEKARLPVPANRIAIWAYPIQNGHMRHGGKNLEPFVQNAQLNWSPDEGDWQLMVFIAQHHPGTLNLNHPDAGKAVIEKFFQQFENNTQNQTADGLNYFFQDELDFGVGDCVWTDDLNTVFKQQKGYDLFEVLPALFGDLGKITPKARLDFMDVKMQLSEERYFKPIFDWHWSRGKIYGCDPGSRGRNPAEFGDYFRAVRWYTAPGHDTPGGHADLIKGKVSSSIASLYRRPRVWLEGYHSLGWQAAPERLLFATSENYLYGCNLLNLHGLYYTTHGSFWEWAPPSYHFRMPYWDHMEVFLNYFDRLSFLLSQGELQADIAIMYPVSPMQADMKTTPKTPRQRNMHHHPGIFSIDPASYTKTAFESGTQLFNNGYDFIFMDHQSLARAEIENQQLKVPGGSYKILVLPDMKAVRWSTIRQALRFFENGGTVIAVGELPRASDRAGRDDPELHAALEKLFGKSASHPNPDAPPRKQTNQANGTGMVVKDAPGLTQAINTLLRKHVTSENPVRAMHRKTADKEIYMVMGTGKDTWCTFQTTGKVEEWNPWTGEVKQLYEVIQAEDETRVKLSFEPNQGKIVVFTPSAEHPIQVLSSQLEEISAVRNANGKVTVTGIASTPGIKKAMVSINGKKQMVSGMAPAPPAPLLLDGDWEFKLKPTMDNRWGDFRLPVKEKIIGAEARRFRYIPETGTAEEWEHPGTDDAHWPEVTAGYGPKFWKLGPLPENINSPALDQKLASLREIDPAKPVVINNRVFFWEPYCFSWRRGIEGDPGDQEGYHGLKKRVTDDFIRLDPPESKAYYYLWTSAHVREDTKVKVHSGPFNPSVIYLNHKKTPPSPVELYLNKGTNRLLLRYDSPGRGHFVLEKPGFAEPNERTPLSMHWWNMKGRVDYDLYPSIENPAGWARFHAPPGLKAMEMQVMGDIQVWVNGQPREVKTTEKGFPSVYRVVLKKPVPRKSKVAIRIEHAKGWYGGSAFPHPILLDCEKGISQTGNWSEGSVLEFYSGGAWYRKKIVLSPQQAGSQIDLNLGSVVATAEVRVNGNYAGTLVAAPWKLDITAWAKKGENTLEILVYNTLANHYRTVPTRYNDASQPSGLIGPVRLEFLAKTVLKQKVKK